MKKPCVTYKVWQEKGGKAVGQAVVVKFSPKELEEQEKGDSWSDVSNVIAHTNIHLPHTYTHTYTHTCTHTHTHTHIYVLQYCGKK